MRKSAEQALAELELGLRQRVREERPDLPLTEVDALVAATMEDTLPLLLDVAVAEMLSENLVVVEMAEESGR